MVEDCAQAGVPLVAFRRAVRFVEITEAVHAAVLHEQFELLRRGEEIHRRFTDLILQGRGAPEILAELALAVGRPVVLEDAAHELVYYQSHPPRAGDDVTLAAWADVHRAEARGEAPEGVVMVDVRLMDSSWGRLMALAIDDAAGRLRPGRGRARRARGRDRPAGPAARGAPASALARRVPLRPRGRSRGRRRRPAAGRGARLPGGPAPRAAGRCCRWPRAARAPRAVRARGADLQSWTRLSGELRAALGSTGLGVLIGPRDADLLVLLALGGRSYDDALAEHVAELFHGTLERRGLGPADIALAIGAPVEDWPAAGAGLRRVRRSAGAATALEARRWHDARRPGVTDLLHDLRDAPEVDAFVDEQLGPLLADGSARSRALLATLEAYLAAGGRKAQAARALHLERQSLYLRLRRIEAVLGVSLDDEDTVLGLHLAVRALRFRRRGAAA